MIEKLDAPVSNICLASGESLDGLLSLALDELNMEMKQFSVKVAAVSGEISKGISVEISKAMIHSN